jgi:hypothetical protein
MRVAILTLGMALAAAAAVAQPPGHIPTRTVQCIELSGQLIPAVCQTPGSRVETREQICTCPNGGTPVDVAVCAPGQTPPPEGRALIRARSAGMRDGSLIGDKVEGRAICVAPRR